MQADYAIIGGGVVGLSIAWGLLKKGRSVLVLDGDDGSFRASRGNFGLVWVQSKGLSQPEKGFRLLFSAGPFPRYDLKLDWLREAAGGNWYRSADFDMDGWLCPALLQYFEVAPRTLYARFEARSD